MSKRRNYRWASAQDWLSQSVMFGDVDPLEALNALLDKIEQDDIEDIFGKEMDADGYFDEEKPHGN
jgi:hypothetical protein